MSIKLLAVDMDGTFLTSDNTYQKERFMKQYEELKKQGIRFVVASGNQYYQLRSFFPEIHEDLAFVAENGAYVIDESEEVFVGKLSNDDLQIVLSALEKYPTIKVIVAGKKSAYINENVEQSYYDEMKFYCHRLAKVKDFKNLDDQIFKIYLSCTEDNFEQILEELTEEVGHIMIPVDCGHFGIDLIIPGINKAHGLKLLLKRWGHPDGKIVAFGDSGNDYEMLELATHSFAMDNAKLAIKEVADHTITSNNDGGVFDAIDWLLNEEQMFEKK